MNIKFRRMFCRSACIALLPLALSQPVNAAASGGMTGWSAREQLPLTQVRACRSRVGPFVTQTTAYQRRRQAQALGYQVSGVFPGYASGTRSYFFNVFWTC